MNKQHDKMHNAILELNVIVIEEHQFDDSISLACVGLRMSVVLRRMLSIRM